jgi:DNA-directed RNA polymerase specialized sigma24 family protein
MSAQDLSSLVNDAKRGNTEAVTALIMAIARDLRAFIATFASSPAMMEDVHTATWMQVRREIAACPPSSQVIIWIRQRAMVLLQHRLEQERNQAIAAKDGLRHLVAQDGIEGLLALASPTNDAATHINQKYSELDENAQILIHRRYAEKVELDILAAEMQLSGQAEVAIRLFIARSLLHWHASADHARAPDDRLFPVTIELSIACSIAADARKQFSLSLLKDLSRAASYTRQVRIDLLLRAIFGAYTQDDANALADGMGKIEHKRRNESSLLQVAPPTRTPVGSGSELRRVQDHIAERQTRVPNTPSPGLPENHGSSHAKRRMPSSNQRPNDNQRNRSKRGKPPVLMIGGGIALVGVIALLLWWLGGSDDSTHGDSSTTQGKYIATVLDFQGDFVMLDGATQKPGTLGQSLIAGQGLRSGDSSEITIELSQNSRLVVGAKTEVGSFDQLADGTGQALIDKGLVHIQSMAAPGVEIRTVQARIHFGVARGSVTVESDRTVVQAISGAIIVNAINGSGAITVPLGGSVITLSGAAPKLVQPRAYVRGINLGGIAVTIDGQKWLAHRQALSAGLHLSAGTEITAVGAMSANGLDFDRKSMIDTGLSATGKPVEIIQTAPNGEYDVTLWLGNTGSDTNKSLSVSLNDKNINVSAFYLSRSGWAQVGPISVNNTSQQLSMNIDGLGTARVSGLLIEAPQNTPLKLPASIHLISPTDASSFGSNEDFLMQAEVVGKAKSVQFYAGDVLLGETSEPPYQAKVNIPTTGEYKLTAKAITPDAPPSTSLPLGISITESFGKGSITFARWTNLRGLNLRNVDNNERIKGEPNDTFVAKTFQSRSDIGDNYYSRARGYLHPPITGDYVFWVTGDDDVELWLSSDDTNNQIKKIAYTYDSSEGISNWTKYPTQESKPIPLVRGKRYFVVLRHREGAGHDYAAVGWKLPNGVMNRPISGAHLSPADTP